MSITIGRILLRLTLVKSFYQMHLLAPKLYLLMSAKIVRPCHCGVFIGLKQIGSFAYHLHLLDGVHNHPIFHVSRLKELLRSDANTTSVLRIWLPLRIYLVNLVYQSTFLCSKLKIYILNQFKNSRLNGSSGTMNHDVFFNSNTWMILKVYWELRRLI